MQCNVRFYVYCATIIYSNKAHVLETQSEVYFLSLLSNSHAFEIFKNRLVLVSKIDRKFSLAFEKMKITDRPLSSLCSPDKNSKNRDKSEFAI